MNKYHVKFKHQYIKPPKTQEEKVAWVEELEKLDDRDEY